jgi:hypothetical protein
MILAILSLLALLPQIQSKTFYIKPATGVDANSGETVDLARKTWTEAMKLVTASAEANILIFAEAGEVKIDSSLTLTQDLSL